LKSFESFTVFLKSIPVDSFDSKRAVVPVLSEHENKQKTLNPNTKKISKRIKQKKVIFSNDLLNFSIKLY
jgi:hypothetical protein